MKKIGDPLQNDIGTLSQKAGRKPINDLKWVKKPEIAKNRQKTS